MAHSGLAGDRAAVDVFFAELDNKSGNSQAGLYTYARVYA